jgi:hypothetical protein
LSQSVHDNAEAPYQVGLQSTVNNTAAIFGCPSSMNSCNDPSHFISVNVVDDMVFPQHQDRHRQEVERHSQSDLFGREMAISKERKLIIRQTRMIQDLEEQHQERIRKGRLY